MGGPVLRKGLHNLNLIRPKLPKFTSITYAVLLVAGSMDWLWRYTPLIERSWGAGSQRLIWSDTVHLSIRSSSNKCSTAAGNNVAYIPQLGVEVSAVTVDGNTVFVGIEPELVVFGRHKLINSG